MQNKGRGFLDMSRIPFDGRLPRPIGSERAEFGAPGNAKRSRNVPCFQWETALSTPSYCGFKVSLGGHLFSAFVPEVVILLWPFENSGGTGLTPLTHVARRPFAPLRAGSLPQQGTR